MPKTLNVRDVPDELHRALVARAARRGISLRQYTIEVLPGPSWWLTLFEERGRYGKTSPRATRCRWCLPSSRQA